MPYSYPKAPSLNALPVSERCRMFRKTVLMHLQQGLPADKVRGVLEDTVENEEYEMAQGIADALEAFGKQPQLSLF